MKLKNFWSSWKVSLWLVRNPGRFLRLTLAILIVVNNTKKYAWCTCTARNFPKNLSYTIKLLLVAISQSVVLNHSLTWDYLIYCYRVIYWGVTILIQTISLQFWRSAFDSSARRRLYSAQPSCFIPRHFNWRVRISKSKWFVFFLTLNFLLW
jgi:hypothetical protein